MKWFKKHKILTVILVIVVLAVIGGAAGGGKKSDSSSPSSKSTGTSKTADSKAQVAKIGETARDGKFEFTVKSIECGIASVGPNQYLTKAAQGQFCKMTLDVKNIGDAQQYFSETDQKILNSTNQQFSPDATATLYNSNNSDALAAQINPGNTVEGVLVFDIPKDQTPVTAELHDSSFSNGVKVTLQ